MLQSLFDAFAGGSGKRLGTGFRDALRMFVSGAMQNLDLFCIAATPFADEKVQPQADLLEERQFVVQGF